VGVQYVAAWLGGQGCVPLYHLMEDAATAEICRAQLWQWVRHGARTRDGQHIDAALFDRLLAEELDVIAARGGPAPAGELQRAAALFADMVRRPEFDEFLTLPAYELLP
jgi:malate synthase